MESGTQDNRKNGFHKYDYKIVQLPKQDYFAQKFIKIAQFDLTSIIDQAIGRFSKDPQKNNIYGKTLLHT